MRRVPVQSADKLSGVETSCAATPAGYSARAGAVLLEAKGRIVLAHSPVPVRS